MVFIVLRSSEAVPKGPPGTVFLRIDNWNDYSFVTMFDMEVCDSYGVVHDVGRIKIGFRGQTTETATHQKLKTPFKNLHSEFFSLGQGVSFYKNMSKIPEPFRDEILESLNDVVANTNIIEGVKDEPVFRASFLRNVSLSVIVGQYARVLSGKAELTNFNFKFKRPESESFGAIEMDFDVNVGSTPSTNIHSIIGRNGVGKTTLLNDMIEAITNRSGSSAKFYEEGLFEDKEISDYFFSSLVSVSFSAFDPFNPPKEQPNPAKGTCYFYIGLKDRRNDYLHRSIEELQRDCTRSLVSCFNDAKKKDLWFDAIDKLGSDENFSSMRLQRLFEVYERCGIQEGEQVDSNDRMERYFCEIRKFLNRMSSGHAVVFFTITRLVATVEEKTLVLLDEPESHLHPPLLSAFIRALSDLLLDQNGVAIIATHSPVVLQEIPRSCVWKVYRSGSSLTPSRPKIETFAENVGVLTTEIFSLEVERSGFHDLLANYVKSGNSFQEIINVFDNQLGFEGRAILKGLIANRDRGNKQS